MNKQIILVPGGRQALHKIYEDLTNKYFNKTNKYSQTVFVADNYNMEDQLAAMYWSKDSRYFPEGSDGKPMPGVEGVWCISLANSIDEIVKWTGCAAPKIN